MRKKMVSVLLTAAMLLSMAACGTSENRGTAGGDVTSTAGGTEAAGGETGGETVLTFPTYYVGENVGAIYFEPAVERFNEQNAGKYKVVLEEVVESTYADKMSQLAQSGKLPALIQVTTPEWMNTVLIQNNLYYPMNDFLEAHPEIKALCVDASLEFCTQENGDIVSLPTITLSNIGTYYNSALYTPEKNIADMTVDEFVESLGENKIAFQSAENGWTSMLFLTALIANEEGGKELLMEYDGKKLLDFNQEPIISAVKKFQQIWKSNAAANAVGAAYADAANGFMSGQSAVFFNGSWMNAEFKEDASDKWSGDFKGADVKADYYPGNVAICNTKTFGRYAITNGGTDQERECAETFLAFLYSQEELETFAVTEGAQIPKLTYSADALTQLEEKPLVKAQTELITEKSVIVPALASIMVDSVANNVFANDLVQLANGAMTPEQFCQDLTTKSAEASE